MVLVNREDKIHFIKDRLSKESLNDIIQALEMHPNGDIHCILIDLMNYLTKKKNVIVSGI